MTNADIIVTRASSEIACEYFYIANLAYPWEIEINASALSNINSHSGGAEIGIDESIGASTAIDNINSALVIDYVIPSAAVNRIVPSTGVESIITRTTVEGIVTTTSADLIITSSTREVEAFDITEP